MRIQLFVTLHVIEDRSNSRLASWSSAPCCRIVVLYCLWLRCRAFRYSIHWYLVFYVFIDLTAVWSESAWVGGKFNCGIFLHIMPFSNSNTLSPWCFKLLFLLMKAVSRNPWTRDFYSQKRASRQAIWR